MLRLIYTESILYDSFLDYFTLKREINKIINRYLYF